MNPIIGKCIQVEMDKEKFPSTFIWRGNTFRITAIQEIWRLVGAWWDGESEKTFFRAQCVSGGIYELSYDHQEHEWSMERVED